MKLIFIIIIAFLLRTGVCRAQSVRDTTLFNSERDSTVFYIDWTKIGVEDKGVFIRMMVDIAKSNDFYKKIQVLPNENISRLIRDNYDIVEEKSKHTYDALVSVIHDLNGLDKQNTLIAGAELRLPRLPVARSKKSTRTLTQFFDPYLSQAYILSTDSASNSNLTAAIPEADFASGGLYAYKLSPDDLRMVKKRIPRELYRKLYGKALVTLDSVHIAMVRFPERQGGGTDGVVGVTAVDSLVAGLLRGVEKRHFGTYYVFDNFNGSSTHGKKVMDVIHARFGAYGLDTAGLNIRKVPINYFDNIAFGREVLNGYYARSGVVTKDLPGVELDNEATLLARIDTAQYAYSGCKDCIPEVYLHALFCYYYRDTPDVISSSFWADMELRGILPRLYLNPVTSLVTAALNEDGEINDKTYNVLVDKDLLTGAKQPLYDYLNAYDSTGALIIGNRLNKGVFSGSHGRHITTTGLGAGWSGGTIMPTDMGTSFATPDVATKIYIAKAYWRSKQADPVYATETRIRVLLATDIDSVLVSKFDSGGSVNMLKLLQTDNYAELLSGEIVPVTNLELADAGIHASTFDATGFGRRGMERGAMRERICGFAFVDGRFYKFSESVLRWEPATFKIISVTFATPEGPVEIKSEREFREKFKQLIILKNP